MDKEPRTLITKAFVEKQSEDRKGVIDVAVASSGIVDRYGEVVDPNSWKLKNFLENPVFLWGHNIQEYKPPIGAVEKLWFENDKLMFRARFDLEDEFAHKIWRKFDQGFLNAFSVGFQAHDWEVDKKNVVHYTKSELLEISAVAVPANPEALAKMKKEGLETKTWSEIRSKNDSLVERISTLEDSNKRLRDEIKALREAKAKKQSKKPTKPQNKTKIVGEILRKTLEKVGEDL